MKKFQFTLKPRDEEDQDLKDPAEQGSGQACSDRHACCCPVRRSSWNCDGEILNCSAIEVR